MQVPIRKPGKYTHLKPDPHMTVEKFNELKNKMEHLKNVSHPRAALEVRRLAEMGDLSDNFAYSMAKGRLRGINQRIFEIEEHLKKAIIIKPGASDRVVIGSTVTVEVNGKQKTYQILGSSETDPLQGVISHNSPIGSALLNKKVNDIVRIKPKDQIIEYKIVNIK
ncbi:transcription elongation factor GreA [Candidatus Falkowbacteria bacterium]|nr:transcription elongation factor GreA [Candidatus Falkowbacteria bacterium]